jgi:putative ABC transport system substrate-binding protein
MRRREFITLLGGAAAAWPLAARAQQPTRRPRLGTLIYSTPERDPNAQSFLRGLRDLGYIDGENIGIEYRFAEGKPERLRDLAAELVRTKPDMIFALGGDVTPFVVRATQTIPIVYAMSADPVQVGVADSLAKPGGKRHRRHLLIGRACRQTSGGAQGGGSERLSGWISLES